MYIAGGMCVLFIILLAVNGALLGVIVDGAGCQEYS